MITLGVYKTSITPNCLPPGICNRSITPLCIKGQAWEPKGRHHLTKKVSHGLDLQWRQRSFREAAGHWMRCKAANGHLGEGLVIGMDTCALTIQHWYQDCRNYLNFYPKIKNSAKWYMWGDEVISCIFIELTSKIKQKIHLHIHPADRCLPSIG